MKKIKRINGKCIKWIDTRYAKPFLVRKWLATAKIAAFSGAAMAHINQIKNTPTFNEVDQIRKTQAIQMSITQCTNVINEILKSVNEVKK